MCDHDDSHLKELFRENANLPDSSEVKVYDPMREIVPRTVRKIHDQHKVDNIRSEIYSSVSDLLKIIYSQTGELALEGEVVMLAKIRDFYEYQWNKTNE